MFGIKKITAFVMASVITFSAMSGFIKVTADEIHAASLPKLGDVNKDNTADVLDLTQIRRSIAKGTDGELNVHYEEELRSFLLGKSDEIIQERIIDSDEDGISDWDEIYIYGTDPQDSDSDDDKLTDYEEIFLTGTDPLTSDSFKSGTLDGSADIDGDGLSNLDEVSTYGTNPLNPDTDEDGLSDYEEVKTHKTNPLEPDSDTDGIPDGDEIKLGLNPNNTKTNGYPDTEYVSKQIIPVDHPLLWQINTDNNPYALSIEITAAGLAESNLDVIQSGYSYLMTGGSSLGAAPELIYNEDFAVESIKLIFEVKSDYLSNIVRPEETKSDDVRGVRRLNVFKYFEDVSTLMPIITEYEGDNIVTATLNTFETDENGKSYGIGSYCLTDIEMWTEILIGSYEESLGLPDFVYEELDSISALVEEVEEYEYFEEEIDGELVKDVDIVPNIVPIPHGGQLVDSSASVLGLVISLALAETIRANEVTLDGGNTRFTAIEFGGHTYARFEDKVSWTEAQAICQSKGGHLVTVTSSSELAFLMNYMTVGADSSYYWVGARRTGNSWGSWVTGESMSYVLGRVYQGYGAGSLSNSIKELFLAKNFNDYISMTRSPDTAGFICEWEAGRAIRGAQPNGYRVVTQLGGRAIYLSAPLRRNSSTDTNGDGIPDWRCVNFSAIDRINGNNTSTSVTYGNTSNYLRNNGQPVDTNAVGRAIPNNSSYTAEDLNNSAYVPLTQDPTKDDTDGDYYPDNVDKEPGVWNKMVIPDDKLCDKNSINRSNPSTDVSASITDGKIMRVEDSQYVTKNLITFNRNTNYSDDRCIFTIHAEDSSDYVIMLSDDKLTVTVTYDKWNEVVTPYFEETVQGVKRYYYSLVYNRDYTIEVKAPKSVEFYTVGIKQDNWIYAPNGGVRYGVPITTSFTTCTETYLTDEVIYEVIMGQYYIQDGLPHKTTLYEYLNDREFSYEKLEHFAYGRAKDMLLDAFELGDKTKENIMTTVGDIHTYYGLTTGLLSLFYIVIPGSTVIGGLMTVGNGIMLLVRNANENMKKDLGKAIYDGVFNICISSYEASTPGFKGWDRSRYINKYTVNGLRCIEVIPFDYENQTIYNENDSWHLKR